MNKFKFGLAIHLLISSINGFSINVWACEEADMIPLPAEEANALEGLSPIQELLHKIKQKNLQELELIDQIENKFKSKSAEIQRSYELSMDDLQSRILNCKLAKGKAVRRISFIEQELDEMKMNIWKPRDWMQRFTSNDENKNMLKNEKFILEGQLSKLNSLISTLNTEKQNATEAFLNSVFFLKIQKDQKVALHRNCINLNSAHSKTVMEQSMGVTQDSRLAHFELRSPSALRYFQELKRRVQVILALYACLPNRNPVGPEFKRHEDFEHILGYFLTSSSENVKLMNEVEKQIENMTPEERRQLSENITSVLSAANLVEIAEEIALNSALEYQKELSTMASDRIGRRIQHSSKALIDSMAKGEVLSILRATKSKFSKEEILRTWSNKLSEFWEDHPTFEKISKF